MKNGYLRFLPLLFVSNLVFAQKDFNIWHIGRTTGISIDFNVTPPVIMNSPIQMAESGATICDPNTGAVIMFADHNTVWNSSHNIIANGTGLEGSNSTAQGSLLLPHPCGGKKYILFQNDIGEFPFSLPDFGLSYSIVDMSLENGSGRVVEKNIPISNQIAEPMIAINDTANGYWLLCHKIESHEYVVYHIGNDGIDPDITTLTTSNFVDNPGQGGFCATYDGSKIAFGQKTFNGYIELLNFDIRTGLLEPDTTLFFDTTDLDIQYAISVSFSPDGSKLYAVDFGHLYQFDMSSGEDIERTILFRRDTTVGFGSFYFMQLAPDGKIYVTEQASSDTAEYIGVIKYPNEHSFNCGFDPFAFAIPTAARVFGVPAVNKSMYASNYFRPVYTVDFEIEKIDPYTISLINTSVNADSTSWDFGDGITSNEFSPTHFYQDTGQYQIVLNIFNKYGCQLTLEKIVNINDILISTTVEDRNQTIIFPNPVHHTLTIESETPISDIEIVNLTGQVFYHTKVTASKHVEIDVTHFPNQVYIVRIRTGPYLREEKFIKL